MICILRVVGGPAAGTKCWLKRDQRVIIGRLSTADFSIPADQHMSRTHMVVEGSGAGFRIRDGGSANGTYVNDARITLIELRVGDQIRAGTSVFDVEFEEDQTEADKREQAPPVDPSIPERTLTIGDLQNAGEVLTARFNPKSVSPNFQSTSATSSSSEASSEADSSSGAIDIPVTLLHNFPEQRTPFLWTQQVNEDTQDPKSIVDQLARVIWGSELCLIVNRSQLDEYEQIKLDEAVTEGNGRQLTETLFCLSLKRKPDLLKFYKRCLRRDAAVLIATPEPIQDKWIFEAIDALSYPSMLFELLVNSDARAKKMVQHTHFLLFEINTQGEMCLLRASQMR